MSTDALYFSADKALAAMGNTSRRWQSHHELNKIFTPPGEIPVVSAGPGRGKRRKLSLAAIVQGRIAFALIDCGVDVRDAYRAGAQFAYGPDDPTSPRPLGRLFPTGSTFLIYSVACQDGGASSLNIMTDADPTFCLSKSGKGLRTILATTEGDDASPRIVVNLTGVCKEVASALAMDFTAAFSAEVM